MAQSGRATRADECPLLGAKRTVVLSPFVVPHTQRRYSLAFLPPHHSSSISHRGLGKNGTLSSRAIAHWRVP